MKTLYDYIQEEIGAAAPPSGGTNTTPANTTGMGNPDPSNIECATTPKPKPRRKKKAERTDEAFKFPFELFMKSLLNTFVEFGTKIEIVNGELVVLDEHDKVVGNLGKRISKRTLATAVIKG